MIKERSDGYNQVCVWPATIVPDNEVEEFETWFLNEFNARVQFLEIILTAPDIKDGSPVPDSGGRSDAFFAVYDEDLMKFAVPRLSLNIRWIEDVLENEDHDNNGEWSIYPDHVSDYKSW